MTKVLVTGGAGYIGSQTVYNLLDSGYQVIVADSLENGHPQNLPESVKLIQVDLRSYQEIQDKLQNLDFDAVIHFAAGPATNDQIPENFEGYYGNNFFSSYNLARFLIAKNIKKLVFSSTAAAYGNPQELPIKENQLKEPLNMYGNTKRMAEIMWSDLAKMHGFKITVVRYFNAAGADKELRTGEMHDPETHLIPIILEVAAGLRPKLTIFGDDYKTLDGSCVRDYIHVLDLASAHIKALEYMGTQKPGYFQDFNLGTGNGYSNFEILEMVRKITNKPIPVEIGKRRPGDWDSAYADNTKAQTILGWKPENSDLETIIKTAWKWFKKSKNID